MSGCLSSFGKSIDWTVKQLERCEAYQSTCSSLNKTSLPTRILVITGVKSVHLRESDAATGTYACLSHCWGSHREHVLPKRQYYNHGRPIYHGKACQSLLKMLLTSPVRLVSDTSGSILFAFSRTTRRIGSENLLTCLQYIRKHS